MVVMTASSALSDDTGRRPRIATGELKNKTEHGKLYFD